LLAAAGRGLLALVLVAVTSVTTLIILEHRRIAPLLWVGAAASAAWAAITPRSFVSRALGLTTHPNHFGLACVLAVGLGLGLAMSSTGWHRASAVAGVVLLIAGVALSGSRAAVLGLVVVIRLTAVLARSLRILVVSGVTALLAAMAVIAGLVHIPESNALSRLAGGGGSAASDLGRELATAEAFASINRHPFTGEGFEFAQAAHNIYLQVLVVGGPLALVSFLCVSGLIARAGQRAIKADRSGRDGPLLVRSHRRLRRLPGVGILRQHPVRPIPVDVHRPSARPGGSGWRAGPEGDRARSFLRVADASAGLTR
jgi:O-antigen ligase